MPMTTEQAAKILQSNRPAPANDFITIPITMTREEWRAIESAADTMECKLGTETNHLSYEAVRLRRRSFFPSAWEKIRHSIVDKI